MAYRPSRKKRHKTDPGQARLQLTSMMDMFTIILVFLIKIYSTHGQLITPSIELKLPESNIQEHPQMEEVEVTVSETRILVNGIEVEKISNIDSDSVYVIPALQTELKFFAEKYEKREKEFNIPFTGEITIQGDKRLPFRRLIKSMATCGQSKFPNMRLVVYKKE